MKPLQKSVNQRFVSLSNRLKNDFGVSSAHISKEIGITTSKMSRIINGLGSATEQMIKDLYLAFPQLKEKITPPQDYRAQLLDSLKQVIKLQDKIIELNAENEKLKEEIKRLKGG